MSEANSIAQQLALKMKLEEQFRPKASRLFGRIAGRAGTVYRESGLILNANDWRGDWTELLAGHYATVGKGFSNVAFTLSSDASSLASREFATYAARHALQQAAFITQTNQKDIFQAFEEARIAIAQAVSTFSNAAVAALGTTLLRGKFNARIGGIAETETQNPAEARKFIEAEIVDGGIPGPGQEGPRGRIVKKWRTVGDSAVRDAHVMANGQVVGNKDAFIVGGDRLMYPSDTSLGASIGNVINCRCTVIYSREDEGL